MPVNLTSLTPVALATQHNTTQHAHNTHTHTHTHTYTHTTQHDTTRQSRLSLSLSSSIDASTSSSSTLVHLWARLPYASTPSPCTSYWRRCLTMGTLRTVPSRQTFIPALRLSLRSHAPSSTAPLRPCVIAGLVACGYAFTTHSHLAATLSWSLARHTFPALSLLQPPRVHVLATPRGHRLSASCTRNLLRRPLCTGTHLRPSQTSCER
jgi:hypothetical protein